MSVIEASLLVSKVRWGSDNSEHNLYSQNIWQWKEDRVPWIKQEQEDFS